MDWRIWSAAKGATFSAAFRRSYEESSGKQVSLCVYDLLELFGCISRNEISFMTRSGTENTADVDVNPSARKENADHEPSAKAAQVSNGQGRHLSVNHNLGNI